MPEPNIKSFYYSIVLGVVFVAVLVWFRYYDLRNYGKYAVAVTTSVSDVRVCYSFSWKNKTYQDCQDIGNSHNISKGDYVAVIHSTRFPGFNNLLYSRLKPASIHKRIDTMKVDKGFITWRRIFYD